MFLLSIFEFHEVEATAYCLRGTTRSGAQAGPRVIAVDPRYIPLGSIVFIEGRGRHRALDTGRLIKGWIIDIWMPTRRKCLRWGRRHKVRIAILKREGEYHERYYRSRRNRTQNH